MPGDLNLKKSWNPALVKTQTKIWEQEQKTLEEFNKIKQREEELKKEKELNDLIQLKHKFNRNLNKQDKLQLNKLNWMYDVPAETNHDTKPPVNKNINRHNKWDGKPDNNSGTKEIIPDKNIRDLDPMKKIAIDALDPMKNFKGSNTQRVHKDYKSHRSHSSRHHRHKSDRHRQSSRRDADREPSTDHKSHGSKPHRQDTRNIQY